MVSHGQFVSQIDVVEIARRYRSVVIAMISTSILYASAIVLGLTGTNSISFGPCTDLPAPLVIIVLAAVKLYALTSVVRLSNRLGDPSAIGIVQFLLMMPFLIDVPVLAFNVLRARSTLRSAGIRCRWYSSVRTARRSSNKLCLKCGYNLTGNLSGVCPECGMKV